MLLLLFLGSWYRNGVKLSRSDSVKIRAEDTKHLLIISDVTPDEAAEFAFVAADLKTTAQLTVKDAPVVFTKKLEDVNVLELQTVELECEVSKSHGQVCVNTNFLKDIFVLHGYFTVTLLLLLTHAIAIIVNVDAVFLQLMLINAMKAPHIFMPKCNCRGGQLQSRLLLLFQSCILALLIKCLCFRLLPLLIDSFFIQNCSFFKC